MLTNDLDENIVYKVITYRNLSIGGGPGAGHFMKTDYMNSVRVHKKHKKAKLPSN